MYRSQASSQTNSSFASYLLPDTAATAFILFLVGCGLALKADGDTYHTLSWTWAKVSLLLLVVLSAVWMVTSVIRATCPNLCFNLRYNSWAKNEKDSNIWFGLVFWTSIVLVSALFFVLAQFNAFSPLLTSFETILTPTLWTGVGLSTILGGSYLVLLASNKPMADFERKKFNRKIAGVGFFFVFFTLYTTLLFMCFDSSKRIDDWTDFAHKTQNQEQGALEVDHMRDGDHILVNYGTTSLEEVPAELASLKSDTPNFSDRFQKILDRRSAWFRDSYYLLDMIDPIHHVWKTEVNLTRDSCRLAITRLTPGYTIKTINGHPGGLSMWCRNLVENHMVIESKPDYFQ